MTGSKFLLIREIGAGLWNEIHHVLTQLLIAEILQRIPVVYWGKGSLYASADGSNAFEQFFLPISGFCVQDLAREEFFFCPEGWNSGNVFMPNRWGTEEGRHKAPEHLKQCDADVCIVIITSTWKRSFL